jgi:hypothetical protein
METTRIINMKSLNPPLVRTFFFFVDRFPAGSNKFNFRMSFSSLTSRIRILRCFTWRCKLVSHYGENMALNKISEPTREKTTWGWETLHNEKFRDSTSAPNIRVIKSKIMWAGNVTRTDEKRYHARFWEVNLNRDELTGGVQFINQCGSEYGEVTSCEHEQWTFFKWLVNWPFIYSALHFILCTEFSQFLRRIPTHWFLSSSAHTLKCPLSHIVTTTT